MITLLIFILMVITFFLAICHYKKAYLTSFLMTMIVFLSIGCGVFSALTLNHLEPPNETLIQPHWAKRNAIVVLGAGSVALPQLNIVKPTVLAYSRINETAHLYFLCKKTANTCQIIISGGDASRTGKSEALIYQQALLNLGVNNADIILEQRSMNTYENAEFTSAILKSESFNNVFLVTSGLHMKRALIYFSYFGIDAIPARSDYIAPMLFAIPIGYNFAIADFIMHEYIGILRLYVYDFFGWNVSK